LTTDLLLLTVTLANDRPVLSSEKAPRMDRTETFKQEISGHEPQTGLDTKTGRLTDRQSQCDFDFFSEVTELLNFVIYTFEALIAVDMKTRGFWDVTQCILCLRDLRRVRHTLNW
jgi:hypothetical protein